MKALRRHRAGHKRMLGGLLLQSQHFAARKSISGVQPCRFSISLIQIGANGDVQPFEHG